MRGTGGAHTDSQGRHTQDKLLLVAGSRVPLIFFSLFFFCMQY